MTEQNDSLTIQQAAEMTGLSVHTLRYYERVGLIHTIGRAENTHRRYSLDDVGWINFLNKLRATGMSIQEMQRYSELQRLGDETLPERVEMLKMLRALTPEQWQRKGIHYASGEQTVVELATNTTLHDVNHIEQIIKALGSSPTLSTL